MNKIDGNFFEQKVIPHIQLNVDHDVDEFGGITFEEAVSNYEDVLEGFTHTQKGLLFRKTSTFESFIKRIEEKYGKFNVYDYSDSLNSFKKYFSDDIRGYMQSHSKNKINVLVSCKSEENLQEIWKIYQDEVKDEKADISIENTTYYLNKGDISTDTTIIEYSEIEKISKDYYPYLKTDLLFDRFLLGDENILLLVGEPGIGKSKFSSLAMKYCFDNYNKLYESDDHVINVVMVKSKDVLSMDAFWTSLKKLSDENDDLTLAIIDDLDFMLTDRKSEVRSGEDVRKNDFLNQFLSFTDGVTKNKVKFIITTNQTYNDIDSAVLRKGRLFDILELRRLKNAEAKTIWINNKLDESIFNEKFTSENVLQSDLGSEIEARKNELLAHKLEEKYVLEDGISKLDETTTSKKFGI